MEKFFGAIILMILLGILTHTVCTLWRDRNKRFKKQDFDLIDEKILLDNRLKWKLWIYLMSFSLFLLFSDILSSGSLRIIELIIVFVILVAIGDYLHSVKFDGFFGIMFYVLQLLVLLTYVVVFTESYLSSGSNLKVLILTIVILITYSFLFIKNVIDSFSSYVFQFINFIFILLFLNIVGIGLTFGTYYFSNHEIYNIFTEKEINLIGTNLEKNDMQLQYSDLTLIIYRGIEPFYNFPNNIDSSKGVISFIPLLENVIGNMYNLLIIGFFVSYSVSTLFERRKTKLYKRKADLDSE